jgi:uracil-DNA glycosylase
LEPPPNPGRFSFSDIDNYARQDADLLSKQISLINPDVIVCCGTFAYTHHFLPNCKRLAPQVFQSGRAYLLDVGHLSQRKKYKDNYDELVKILKALTK